MMTAVCIVLALLLLVTISSWHDARKEFAECRLERDCLLRERDAARDDCDKLMGRIELMNTLLAKSNAKVVELIREREPVVSYQQFEPDPGP